MHHTTARYVTCHSLPICHDQVNSTRKPDVYCSESEVHIYCNEQNTVESEIHLWSLNSNYRLTGNNAGSRGVELVNNGQAYAVFDCRDPLPVEFQCAYGNVIELTTVRQAPGEIPQEGPTQPADTSPSLPSLTGPSSTPPPTSSQPVPPSTTPPTGKLEQGTEKLNKGFTSLSHYYSLAAILAVFINL